MLKPNDCENALHFEEGPAHFAHPTAQQTLSPAVIHHFDRWLALHNARKGHHWTPASYRYASERENAFADRVIDLPVATAADLATVVLMVTAFGEFELPAAMFQLMDRLVGPSFYCHDEDRCGAGEKHNSAAG